MCSATRRGGGSSQHTAAQPNCCQQATVVGLVLPQLGNKATSSPSWKASDKVDWVVLWHCKICRWIGGEAKGAFSRVTNEVNQQVWQKTHAKVKS